MRIVVTGLVATYPLGGVALDYLTYVRGFRQLGHEVFYLEDTGQWLYDPRTYTYTDDVGFHAAYLGSVLERCGAEMRERWSLRAPDGTYHGASLDRVRRECAGADLFLNVSGGCWLRDEYRAAKRLAYLDTDPCYSQAKLDAVERGIASPEQAFSVGLIRAHDCFFTFAENMHGADCAIPHGGLQWHTTRQPLVLADWTMAPRIDRGRYTTVMSWKTDVTLPTVAGHTYGGKDVELRRFLDLPRRVDVELELALSGNAPRAELESNGWHLVDAHSRSTTPEAYLEYLRQSRAEWSIAKNAYVASRSGWFSTRSAAYLAVGKPVVVQDTGFPPYYRVGDGIFPFSTLEEAGRAIATVESDYPRWCEAARASAEREFDARVVLPRLLADAGLA